LVFAPAASIVIQKRKLNWFDSFLELRYPSVIGSSTGSTPSSHHSMHQPHFKSHLYHRHLHRHNTKLSFVEVINSSTPHAPASTSCLCGSTTGDSSTSAFFLQKKEERFSSNVRCLFLDVTDHEKKRRKRKRKKQILIAELYESPIHGSSISHLPLAD
jgi:hypothetical protein